MASAKPKEFSMTRTVTFAVAVKRLQRRYAEQALRFPAMRNDITLEAYIAANIVQVMRNGLLAEYDACETKSMNCGH
jgi:hypothetical protein